MDKTVKVKICGIMDPEMALYCAIENADFIGLNFSPKSIRKILPSTGRIISETISDFKKKNSNCNLKLVNLFYGNSIEEIISVCNEVKCDYIQLISNDMKVQNINLNIPLILSIGVEKHLTDTELQNINGSLIIFDTYKKDVGGGSGESFNWNFIKDVRRNYLLAGGLTPENINKAVDYLKPYGVDVASGVETLKGIKDKNKIREFIKNAKRS